MLIPPNKKKALGQNFLHDQNIITKLIDSIQVQPDDRLVEIGPGPGALTTRLLTKLNSLEVIEIDREVIPFLQQNCCHSSKLHIHNLDVLQFAWHSLGDNLRIVGNLPYNISTPILFHLVNSFKLIRDMHFMFQQEVAERIVALPHSKIYGRLSVMMQYYFDIKPLLRIPPTAFNPIPQVDSMFVRFTPKEISPTDIILFTTVVKEAFNLRRKTIANSLKKYLGATDFIALSIDSKLRPENLTVQDFVTLTNYIGQQRELGVTS